MIQQHTCCWNLAINHHPIGKKTLLPLLPFPDYRPTNRRSSHFCAVQQFLYWKKSVHGVAYFLPLRPWVDLRRGKSAEHETFTISIILSTLLQFLAQKSTKDVTTKKNTVVN